ncbi:hypothetical protein KP509_37G057000 [Ceratopteris richardii]|uniref:Uncharacterized protein n=1 Tax=Ceratopteris richardii TaxID=49495 RepID=A0A8T2Q9D6_CERRI|nr:hypothetical protein KP509_37G057000 [Ceratopteris richardii]
MGIAFRLWIGYAATKKVNLFVSFKLLIILKILHALYSLSFHTAGSQKNSVSRASLSYKVREQPTGRLLPCKAENAAVTKLDFTRRLAHLLVFAAGE